MFPATLLQCLVKTTMPLPVTYTYLQIQILQTSICHNGKYYSCLLQPCCRVWSKPTTPLGESYLQVVIFSDPHLAYTTCHTNSYDHIEVFRLSLPTNIQQLFMFSATLLQSLVNQASGSIIRYLQVVIFSDPHLAYTTCPNKFLRSHHIIAP